MILHLLYAAILLKDERRGLEALLTMVEKHGGIDAAALEMNLEMEMFRRGASCTSCISNNFPGFDMLAHSHDVTALMTVEGLEAIGMTDNDTVAVTEIGATAHDDTVEGGEDRIVGTGLDVYAGMIAAATIGTDDMTAGKGIGPVVLLKFLKVKTECAVRQERIITGGIGVEGVGDEAFAVILCRLPCHCLTGIVSDGDSYATAFPFADEGLMAQLMAAGLKKGRGIDAGTVDHDGEEAVDAVIALADDGDSLSGTDMIADTDEVMGVVGIDGLEAVVMTDNDDIAILCGLTTQSYRTVEHGFYGIALTGCDLEEILAL